MKNTSRANQSKRALTAKGMATRASILDSAHDVFKIKGFYGSSISEITRRCAVSMGTFYQYFKNKEQVFYELNDLILGRFMEKIESVSLENIPFENRLRIVLQMLYRHCRENLAFHTILGESELIESVTIAYYESIASYYRRFFRNAARDGFIRSLDPGVIAYGLIGICYFHSLAWESDPEEWNESQLIELIMVFLLNGINGPKAWKRGSDQDLLSIPAPIALHRSIKEPLTKGEKTRHALFKAAELVIGRSGINRANIFEITREAGVAQGTFYVHFDSKNDLVEGFVKYFNHKARRELQRVAASTKDRRDSERVGILKFFEFARQHRRIYRLIPECEIIRRDVSLWYYSRIAKGYIQGLKLGIDRKEIRNLSPVFLARTLMGFTHFIALKWIIWRHESRDNISKELLQDIIRLIIFGLDPSKP